MALVRGVNALVYVHGAQVPEGNEWNLDITQEKMEAPNTFVVPSTSDANWVRRDGGFFSASGSISALYDDADQGPFDVALGDEAVEILLYPSCDDLNHYWKGDAWVEVSHTTNVDDYSSVDISLESDGSWEWSSE